MRVVAEGLWLAGGRRPTTDDWRVLLAATAVGLRGDWRRDGRTTVDGGSVAVDVFGISKKKVSLSVLI